jgi:hypothetical protein
MLSTTFQPNQEISVLGEHAIVIEQSSEHGWVLCQFPNRNRWKTGWVDPKNIRHA